LTGWELVARNRKRYGGVHIERGNDRTDGGTGWGVNVRKVTHMGDQCV
jgi:hypothetical protein